MQVKIAMMPPHTERKASAYRSFIAVATLGIALWLCLCERERDRERGLSTCS